MHKSIELMEVFKVSVTMGLGAATDLVQNETMRILEGVKKLFLYD